MFYFPPAKPDLKTHGYGFPWGFKRKDGWSFSIRRGPSQLWSCHVGSHNHRISEWVGLGWKEPQRWCSSKPSLSYKQGHLPLDGPDCFLPLPWTTPGASCCLQEWDIPSRLNGKWDGDVPITLPLPRLTFQGSGNPLLQQLHTKTHTEG